MARTDTDAIDTPGGNEKDVLVIGAGVSGLATAFALLQSGRQVTVIDAGRIGGGASHGNCGTITPSHAPPLAAPGMIGTAIRWMLTPDAPLYVHPGFDPTLWRWLLGFAARCNQRDWIASAQAKYALLADSRLRLAEWIRDFGIECEFVESGEDYVFRDLRRLEKEQHELPLLRELGIPMRIVDGPTYEAMEPALKPGVAGAIRFTGDASLRPDRYVSELARLVRQHGGTIIEDMALQSLQSEGDRVSAITASGILRARDVVVATGAWAPRLASAIGVPWLRKAIQPGKGYSITYSRPVLVPKTPLMLRDRSVCVTTWGDGYRLGSTMEFSGFDTRLNEHRLGALERGAREFLHEPVGAQLHERWYGWRPMSRDDIPLIGRAPGHRHLWLATGHGMMGVGMSAGTGQLMADMIQGRAPAIDPTPFDPARFA
jgi:D-amino-acid dehydrogenase